MENLGADECTEGCSCGVAKAECTCCDEDLTAKYLKIYLTQLLLEDMTFQYLHSKDMKTVLSKTD